MTLTEKLGVMVTALGSLLLHSRPSLSIGAPVFPPMDSEPVEMPVSGRGIIENLQVASSTLAEPYYDLGFSVSVHVPTGGSGLTVGGVVVCPVDPAQSL